MNFFLKKAGWWNGGVLTYFHSVWVYTTILRIEFLSLTLKRNYGGNFETLQIWTEPGCIGMILRTDQNPRWSNHNEPKFRQILILYYLMRCGFPAFIFFVQILAAYFYSLSLLLDMKKNCFHPSFRNWLVVPDDDKSSRTTIQDKFRWLKVSSVFHIAIGKF